MNCEFCGEENVGDAAECPSCGRRLGALPGSSRKRRALVAGLCAFVLLAAGGVLWVARPKPIPVLVYGALDKGGGWRIMTLDAAMRSRELVSGVTGPVLLDVSPDGRWVWWCADASKQDGQGARVPYLCRTTGGEPMPLAEISQSDKRGPYWSRDGRWCVVSAVAGKERIAQVVLVDTSGSPRNSTLLERAELEWCDWRPDSKRCLLVTSEGPTGGLYLLTPETGGLEKLARKPGLVSEHAWCEANGLLAVAVGTELRDRADGVFILDPETGRRSDVAVPQNLLPGCDLYWGPDGKWLVLQGATTPTAEGEEDEVSYSCVVPDTGGTPRVILANEPWAELEFWVPGSGHVFAHHFFTGRIGAVDASTGKPVPLKGLDLPFIAACIIYEDEEEVCFLAFEERNEWQLRARVHTIGQTCTARTLYPALASKPLDYRGASAVQPAAEWSKGYAYGLIDYDPNATPVEEPAREMLSVCHWWALPSPDGQQIAVAKRKSGTSIYDVDVVAREAAVPETVARKVGCPALEWSRSGQYLGVSDYGQGSKTGRLHVYDTETRRYTSIADRVCSFGFCK